MQMQSMQFADTQTDGQSY